MNLSWKKLGPWRAFSGCSVAPPRTGEDRGAALAVGAGIQRREKSGNFLTPLRLLCLSSLRVSVFDRPTEPQTREPRPAQRRAAAPPRNISSAREPAIRFCPEAP